MKINVNLEGTRSEQALPFAVRGLGAVLRELEATRDHVVIVARVSTHQHPEKTLEPEGKPSSPVHEGTQQAKDLESRGYDHTFGGGVRACWSRPTAKAVSIWPVDVADDGRCAATRQGLQSISCRR